MNIYPENLSATMKTEVVAESHGLLCGLLCMSDEIDQVAWFDCAREEIASDYNWTSEDWILQDKNFFTELFSKTHTQLDDPTQLLDLALPDEDVYDLDERIVALQAWCQGLLTGLAVMGINLDSQLVSSDVNEILHDVYELSHSNIGEFSEESEEEENAYVELVEYLRVSTPIIYETFREGDVSKNATIH